MKKRKYTTESFPALFIESGRNIEYELLSCKNVKNAHSKFTVKHKLCGQIFDVECSSFFRGTSGCQKCSGNLPKFNQENFLNLWSSDSKKDDYELVDYSNVTNRNSSFVVKHKMCGYTYSVRCNVFFSNGSGCPNCAGNLPKYTKANFLTIWESDPRTNDYELIDWSSVENQKSKITIKHKVCNHIFVVTCNHFFYTKSNCPNCVSSKGEDKIFEFLNDRAINLVRQQTFEGCAKSRLLKFDFFLPDYNLVVEYHGIQHYKSREYFGGDLEFQRIQEYDAYKKQFVLENGYKFLEIPFTLYAKIEKILIDVLNL